jgi:signal transduction histidine kinase
MNRDKLVGYVYEDNKELIILVEEAASLIEKEGEAAFSNFGVEGSKWLKGNRYIFIYDTTGKCIFHPIEPNLVGQDLSSFKDMVKRPVIAMIAAVANKPQPDASGWTFYLWEAPWHSYPIWKGSYIRKVITPSGKVYLVGSGLYNIKIEKIFIQESVDNAVELILSKGKEAAFRELREASCPLHVLDSFIFVFEENGNVIVDPLFPNLAKKRSMEEYQDDTGRNIPREISELLKDKDNAWFLYIAPKIGSTRSTRHAGYVRKIKIDGQIFYVVATFTPATPIWMKQ